jgi:hypothetical protein
VAAYQQNRSGTLTYVQQDDRVLDFSDSEVAPYANNFYIIGLRSFRCPRAWQWPQHLSKRTQSGPAGCSQPWAKKGHSEHFCVGGNPDRVKSDR